MEKGIKVTVKNLDGLDLPPNLPTYGFIGVGDAGAISVKRDIVSPLFPFDGDRRGDLIIYAGVASPSEWKGSLFSRLYCARFLEDRLPFPEATEREVGIGMYSASRHVDLERLSEELTDGAMLAKRMPRSRSWDSSEYVVARRVSPVEGMDARQTKDGFFCKCKASADVYECMAFRDPRSLRVRIRPFGEPGRIELELRLYVAKYERAYKLSADCLFDGFWEDAWK